MIKKTIFFIFFFYILILFQTSFLVHFSLWGIVPNLVLILAVLVNFLSSDKTLCIVVSAIGGLYLDIFSFAGFFGFFGTYTIALMLFSFLLKIILIQYVRIPAIKKF